MLRAASCKITYGHAAENLKFVPVIAQDDRRWAVSQCGSRLSASPPSGRFFAPYIPRGSCPACLPSTLSSSHAMPLIHDITFERPRDVPPYKNFDCYIIVLETVFHDYRHSKFDTSDIYKQRAEQVEGLPYHKLVHAIELKLHERLPLDLGVRCATSTVRLVRAGLSISQTPRAMRSPRHTP